MKEEYTMNDVEKLEYLQEAINEVMDWFDFDKVHKTMTFLEWRWTSGELLEVPDIQTLKKFVRENMKRTYYNLLDGNKTYNGTSSGGFRIECFKDEENVIFFKVAFELSAWDTGE